MADKQALKITKDMIEFIDSSPTASHAVAESARRLEKAGFKPLDEVDSWKIKPGGEYYIVRKHSAIIAFRIGKKAPEKAGFRIIGAHTDTPGLRLKPKALYSKAGYIEAGVEVYGGPILETWADRDLGLAGRVVIKEKNGERTVALVFIDRPVCRIPTLAIHMQKEKEGLKLDKQENLPPVLAIGTEKELDNDLITKTLAENLGISPEKIIDYKLEVVDTQKGVIGGINNEFVFTGRIDNLSSCHAAIEALINSPSDCAFTQAIAFFDNEEVGSTSAQGAGSRFLDNALERICLSKSQSRETFFRALAQSIFISTDGAHAVNPNYSDAHDSHHHPMLNGGPVLKTNASERYTGDIDAIGHIKDCAGRAKVTLQDFVSRSDKPSGSTIGPMTAARLGIAAVDIGTPMVSMHSIREMGGVADQQMMVKLLTEHFS